ncbi:MAG: hypothetical protein V3R98_09075 [Alphaproteobacteria bacterium]
MAAREVAVMNRTTQSVSARQDGAPVARARSRPHRWIPLAAAVVAMLLPAWRDAAGFSATPEDYANFDELMAVDWLLCETLPIWTAAGETIAVIAYDSKEDRYVASLTASDEFSPDFPERHILVFDDEKTRADFLEVSETGALSPAPYVGIGKVASLPPLGLIGGGLLVTWAVSDQDSPDSKSEVAGGRAHRIRTGIWCRRGSIRRLQSDHLLR